MVIKIKYNGLSQSKNGSTIRDVIFLSHLRSMNMKSILFFSCLFISVAVAAQCDSVSPLNLKIVELSKAKMGKKVLRGECWDLAKYVLDETNSKWDGSYVFGEELKKSACLMPGDIIQFKNVRIQYQEGRTKYTELMTHHTAIIFEVNSSDEVVLIHQNTGQTGRKVGTSKMRFSTIVKGSYKIYRPIPN